MNQVSPDTLEAYIQGVLPEREHVLYQQACKKVQVITHRMSGPEKANYLQSASFQQTLNQLKRKDKVYQALLSGKLLLPSQNADYDRLKALIHTELVSGHPIDLAFLRSCQRAKVSLKKARDMLDLIQKQEDVTFFEENRQQLVLHIDQRMAHDLQTRDILAILPEDELPEDVLGYLMQSVFSGKFAIRDINHALAPQTLHQYLQKSLFDALPALAPCEKVLIGSTTTLHARLQNLILRESERIIKQLQHRFPAKRIKHLLTTNRTLQQLQKKASEAHNQKRHLRDALLQAIPENYRDLYPLARSMHRHFVLHLGPTNSGKTFDSIAHLHAATSGIYLGPLRLLAFEKFEDLNVADVPCSLVTGEEQIQVPGSVVQSSTIEMADLQKHYDVAVIDECQMIADHERGGAWTAAMLGLCADEIHVCASPDAENLLTQMILDCGDSFEVMRHERMTPLVVEQEGFQFPDSVRPGDALIVFSKARVHAVAAELRARGQRVSLIYGALPPDVRRNQAERFRKGETDVVVSTDAIAMGMNLPIERVVFLESEKYDGDITRTLTDAEIKQIAGRAGRYGQYDIGYVNAFGFKRLIASALNKPLYPLTEAVIRFPESLLGIPLPLTGILNQWMSLQDRGCFSKASTVRMFHLASMMETPKTDKLLLYRFLCIPFDETDPVLLTHWKNMYHAECGNRHIQVLSQLPEIRDPESCSIHVLNTLEAEYRLCDLYYNYTRLFLDTPDPILQEIQSRKDLISQGIVHILSTQKLLQRACKSCKKRLPWNWPYNLCEHCYQSRHGYRRMDWYDD